jgi:hypothetical protein
MLGKRGASVAQEANVDLCGPKCFRNVLQFRKIVNVELRATVYQMNRPPTTAIAINQV